MNESLSSSIDRALVRWVTGDLASGAALDAMCLLLESQGARCGLVARGATRLRVCAPASQEFAELLAQVAERAAPHRAYHTPRDVGWHSSFGAIGGIERAAWLACEPVLDASGTHCAMLSIVGLADAQRDSVLVALPSIAKACGLVLAHEDAADARAKLQHSANNLLAVVLANVEYASELVDVHVPPSGGTGRDGGVEVRRALGHAATALKELVGKLDELATVPRSDSR